MDVFSPWQVMFEMLTGHSPFSTEKSPIETLAPRMNEAPRRREADAWQFGSAGSVSMMQLSAQIALRSVLSQQRDSWPLLRRCLQLAKPDQRSSSPRASTLGAAMNNPVVQILPLRMSSWFCGLRTVREVAPFLGGRSPEVSRPAGVVHGFSRRQRAQSRPLPSKDEMVSRSRQTETASPSEGLTRSGSSRDVAICDPRSHNGQSRSLARHRRSEESLSGHRRTARRLLR